MTGKGEKYNDNSTTVCKKNMKLIMHIILWGKAVVIIY